MSKATVIDLGAYDWRPKSPNSKCWTFRIGNTTFQFQKLPVMIVSFISFFLLLIYWSFSGSSRIEIQGFNHSYPLTKPLQTPQGIKYRIAVIADLDTDSKSDKNTWKSYLKLGSLTYDFQEENVQINWEDAQELKSSFSIGGRGMELSELVVFNGNLLTVDDRTGIVYKLTENNQKWKIIPWVILADGNGEESKGFKCEWMAVKGQFLYVGGLGKEWTTQDGKVLNFNPMYVKKISKNGHVEHVNWYENYIKLRSRAGIEFPGYMIHESAAWSEVHQKWTFLPRRAHKLQYNDVEDELHGTNLMLKTDESFSKVDLSTIGTLDQPSHGFSSFKFVPNTQDSVIVALKSEEFKGKIASYIMVFKTDGTILYPETFIGDHKYEGIEFV